MGCFPCFGSGGKGEAKKGGGGRKDGGSADRRVARVGSGAVLVVGVWGERVGSWGGFVCRKW